MYSGFIHESNVAGEIDLQAILESGQTFLWRRETGTAYRDADYDGWYWTGTQWPDSTPTIIRVRATDDGVEWESNRDIESAVKHRLGLADDLTSIKRQLLVAAPDDELLTEALDAYDGLRLVSDPSFDCLISFICSPQMRVERIHGMQCELADRFGDTVEFNGRDYPVYPTPDSLASRTKDDLLDAGLGYRASYVRRTAEMIADGHTGLTRSSSLPYQKARETLKEYVGVGDKVADCALLYGVGHSEAVPIDTWVEEALDDHYSELRGDGYAETSRRLREQWGEYAGYAQLYVFHHLRSSS